MNPPDTHVHVAPLPAERIPRNRMIGLACAGVGLVCAGFAVGLLCGHRGGEALPGGASQPSAAAPASAPSDAEETTTLSTEQIHALTLGAVVDHAFRPEQHTSGKIANDDDLTTPVFSLVGGHASALFVQPGDHVEPGQPLVQIDSPDMYQAEIALIAALPATAKVEVGLNQLKSIEARQQRLYDLHAIALRDLEQAQADVRSAETDLQAAHIAQEAARGQLRIFGKSEKEIDGLEHGQPATRIAVITAPLAGTIVSRQIGPGQIVRPDNANPMVIIADLSKVWMSADIYETQAREIELGQPLEVQVLAFPDEVFTGTVSYISPYVDPNTHRITIRCTVDNPKLKLKPEMFATFRVFSPHPVSAPAVPGSAVLHEGQATYVWTVHDGNQFTKKLVTCGPEQDGLMRVFSGLKTGDAIVVKGGLFLDSQ